VPLNEISVEEGASELVHSPDMQPYLRFLKAVVVGKDATALVSGIAELPLEKRYIWRIASAQVGIRRL
jgi:hypothetical protein